MLAMSDFQYRSLKSEPQSFLQRYLRRREERELKGDGQSQLHYINYISERNKYKITTCHRLVPPCWLVLKLMCTPHFIKDLLLCHKKWHLGFVRNPSGYLFYFLLHFFLFLSLTEFIPLVTYWPSVWLIIYKIYIQRIKTKLCYVYFFPRFGMLISVHCGFF